MSQSTSQFHVEQIPSFYPLRHHLDIDIEKMDTVVFHSAANGKRLTAFQLARYLKSTESDPEKRLSYTYIISREDDGKVHIYKCAPAVSRTNHAGTSLGPNGANVNRYSCGICFNCVSYEAPDKEMVKAAEWLVEELKRGGVPLKWGVTHYHISPGRKTDPVGFDVRALNAKTGLKNWRHPKCKAWVTAVPKKRSK